MPVIDADTHVDETEDTWEYMREEELEFKPTTEAPAALDSSRPPVRYWRIDGRRQIRFVRDDQRTRTTVETRELLDVGARLRAMDEMGTDVQVVYPTLFIMEATERPEIALALRRSYNRWMAERCAQSEGRLRWVALPSLMSMDETLEEMRFAKEHGACGVMKKGDREAGRWPADPYFTPFYEEAERLDLAVCFHTGSGTPDFPSAKEFPLGSFYRSNMSVAHAFHTLIANGIPTKHPRLRFTFVEAGSAWIPYVLYDLKRRLERTSDPGSIFGGQRYEMPDNVLKANRMFVTCMVDEDLPYVLRLAGEDNLMIGSDYTHRDQSMEYEYERLLRERVDQGEISASVMRKILYDNPKEAYGL